MYVSNSFKWYDGIRMNMVKWKIGVVLILLILFLPIVANAVETTRKVYSVEELEAYEQDGWEILTGVTYTLPGIISDRAKVDENVLIEGSVQVYMRKEINGEIMTLSGPVSHYQMYVFIYKDDLLIFQYSIFTDDRGFYEFIEFIPREPGYYNIIFQDYRWEMRHPLILYKNTFAFYVSEKDSDGDGVLDQYDYAPYDPEVQTKSDIETPAFEAIFAIIGLLAVAYLFRRRR